MAIFNKTTHDFGNVSRGTEVFTEFTITNDTDKTMVVDNPGCNCGCSTPNLQGGHLSPGETAIFKVGFTGQGTGNAHKSCYVNINNVTQTFYFSANVS